jgi:AraC family transcriptional regulator
LDERINHVIEAMNEKYGEPLSTRDLADIATLSPFHFSRTFRKVTGVPPGRFLSAVRMAKAKQMLTTTSMSVSEISFRVGFNSVGTFTTHFTTSVGVPPTRFRGGGLATPAPGHGTGGRLTDGTDPADGTGTIRGQLRSRPDCPVRTVVVSAYNTPIAEGRPHVFTTKHGTGGWQLCGIPPGECHVIAAAAAECWADRERSAPTRDPAMVGRSGPIVVHPGSVTDVVISLDPWLPTQLPVLSPLPCVTVPCDGCCRRSHSR